VTEVPSRLAAALADRYRIERELGQGGMATVYLAQDRKHDRQVAIKVLKPDLAAVLGAERFIVEIKTTAALSHPHILPLFDSGEAYGPDRSGPYLFYVMPYIDGETIRDRLNRETQLGIDEAVRITREVADALDYAHRHGVVHRDIKPENILLHDGRPMVMDFGIALAVSAAAGGRMTETGLSLGTPHYMSPEQATAEKEITARSDIYSLGSVLYEMLTGNPPHSGGSAQQIIMKIVTEEPAPVTRMRRAVPPNVAAAVAKSLEKLPADRFESAKAFAEALANLAFTHGSLAPGGARGSARVARHRDPAFLALGVAALLAVGLAAWALLQPPAPGPVARHSIRLPDGVEVAGPFARFALTPDGGKLLFLVGDDDTAPELWVRDRDALEATPVPGATLAFGPFVSPSGTEVGFTSWGGVRIVSLVGGGVRALTDSVANAGGSWGPDGMIYLGRVNGALVRVDASGPGSAAPFTTLNVAAGETEHIFPDALPSGKGVLFTIARTANGEEFREIGVARTTDGSHEVLVRGVYARYAASGHLLYVTADGTLMAAAFDQDRLALTGPGVAVVRNLSLRVLAAPDLVITRNGTLLYSAGGRTWYEGGTPVWVSRNGQATAVDSSWSQEMTTIALSPDATHLAFDLGRSTNTADVWVRRISNGVMSRLTDDELSIRPAWMPDGQDLLFVRREAVKDGGYVQGVFRQAMGTRTPRFLFAHEQDLQEILVSRDSAWFVFRSGFGRGGENIYARRRTGDTTTIAIAATSALEVAPTLSPDGRWLAFVSNETGSREVYVQAFPDGGGRKWPVSTGGGTEPLWSRNGQELFYRNGRNEMVAVTVTGSAQPPMGRQQVLFSAGSYATDPTNRAYDVAPDGRRFVMLRSARRPGEDDFRLVIVENFFEELKRLVPK
jgi:serine/threonine-protein kinase